MKIIVNDTNILIDLIKLNLLQDFVQLPCKIHTLDLVIAEITDPQQAYEINSIRDHLIIGQIAPDEYTAILRLQKKNLSFTDCAVLYYTQKTGGILVSGDAPLRKTAGELAIEVKGILFIFEQLIHHDIIDISTAIRKLKHLMLINPRAPKKLIEEKINKFTQTQ